MKRLIRKAGQPLDLYHFTSSQIFMKIMNTGEITPAKINNSTSNGGHVQYWDFASDDTQGNRLTSLKVVNTNIELAQYNNSIQVTQELIDYIEERKKENPTDWERESIEVSVHSPSYNQDGVYLTKSQVDENNYASTALRNNNDTSIPNFEVIIAVSVDTDNLVPDYDDLELSAITLNENAKAPLWKQSLDRIKQVVYNGPINISNITGVKIIGSTYDCIPGDKFDSINLDADDFYNWVTSTQYIKVNQWLDAGDALSMFEQINQNYKMLTPETITQTAKIKRRLRKLLR